MNRKLAIAIATFVSLASAGCQSLFVEPVPGSPPPPEPPPLGFHGEFPPGEKVFIHQRGMIVQIRDPELHLRIARRAFAHGRNTLAASEVEKARGGVSWFEQRAAGERRRRLVEVQQQLRELERRLRRRQVESIHVLDAAFQETLRALAREDRAPGDPERASAERAD